jgi:ketosteroid isomerase-like protein
MNIDEVIAAMYAMFCFEAGQRPDWSRQSEIYASDARLVRVNDQGIFEFDIDSFRSNLESMIDSGALPSFWEGEIWRETQRFGDVAHVLSAYEARPTRNGSPLWRAVKSIQLFEREGGWRISAMIWRRDGRTVRIPDRAPAPISSPR